MVYRNEEVFMEEAERRCKGNIGKICNTLEIEGKDEYKVDVEWILIFQIKNSIFGTNSAGMNLGGKIIHQDRYTKLIFPFLEVYLFTNKASFLIYFFINNIALRYFLLFPESPLHPYIISLLKQWEIKKH